MSQENVERLQAVYSEWARGNFRPGGQLFAPDVAFEALTDGRAAIGRDAVEGYMREFLAHWTEFRIEAEDFVEAGEAILVTERQHGTGKSSGVDAEMTVYSVWTFRDGVVVRVRWEIDRASPLEAAGLSE